MAPEGAFAALKSFHEGEFAECCFEAKGAA
jgi:hypothetical protein